MVEERVSVGMEPRRGRWGWHLVHSRVEWHMSAIPEGEVRKKIRSSWLPLAS